MHCFDEDIATRYGVSQAIIFQYIGFRCKDNRISRQNYHDGCYWMFDSVRAFCERYPYMSKNTINRALKGLVDNGLIIEGTFNKLAYDRTKWYTLTDLGWSIYPKSEMDSPKIRNEITQSQKPIPIKYPIEYPIDNKSFDKSNDMSNSDSWTSRIQRVVESWNTMASSVGLPCLTKVSAGSERYKRLRSRLSEFGDDAFSQCIENVRNSDFLRNANFFSFDWMIRPNNFPKVLEGNYNDRNKANADAYSYDDYEGPEG